MTSILKLQEHLEHLFSNVDIMPSNKGKTPKYGHKDGGWTHEKARAHLSECESGALILLSKELLVVDVDDHDMCLELEALMPELSRTVQTQTQKGKHYYFRQTPLSIHMADCARQLRDPLSGEVLPIDIKTQTKTGTRGVISIPPSPNKKWIRSLRKHVPDFIPDVLIKFYNDRYRNIKLPLNPSESCEPCEPCEPCGPSTPNRSVHTIDRTDNLSCNSQSLYSSYTHSSVQSLNRDEIPLLVDILSMERADNEPDWKKVGWALKTISFGNPQKNDEYLTKWIEFSKKSPKFTVGECNTLWDNMRPEGLGKGSIHMWAKQDSPEAYLNIVSQIKGDCGFAANIESISIGDLNASSQVFPYSFVKQVFEKTVFKISAPSTQFVDLQPDRTFVMRSKTQLFDTYEELFCLDSGPKVNFVRKWMQDGHKRKYRKLDFLPPPQLVPDDVYNLWAGFAIDNIVCESSGNVEPFIYHISLLSGGAAKPNLGLQIYLTKWLAQIVQEPGRVVGISPVFISKQGAGKNIFLSCFARILGYNYYYETQDPEKDLFDRFSVGRLNKLIIDIDEAESKSTFCLHARIKGLITNEVVHVESKGLAPITLQNYSRVVFTSNNFMALKIPSEDRRHFICDVSGEKIGNQSYFKNFHKYMSDLSNQKAIMDYLRKQDLVGLEWIDDRPLTETYRDLQYCCSCTILRFIEHVFSHLDTKTEYKGQELFDTYQVWLKDNKLIDNRGSSVVMVKLKGYGNEVPDSIVKKTLHGRVIYRFSAEHVQILLEKYNLLCL